MNKLLARDNFLETIKRNGKPDRLVKQFEGTAFLPGDPVNYYVRGDRSPGMAPITDLWGTTIVWEPGTPGAMPHVTELNKVIKDITSWRDFVKVPDLIANCSDRALWEPYLERAAAIDRPEHRSLWRERTCSTATRENHTHTVSLPVLLLAK